MAKLDFSDLTKKLNIEGLLDTVKSAVAGNQPLKAPDGDEIAAKFVELIALTQSLANIHAEQAQTISTVHSKLNALYKDVQAFKAPSIAAQTTATPATPTPTPTNTTPDTTATGTTATTTPEASTESKEENK